jgi:alpha-glucosidase
VVEVAVIYQIYPRSFQDTNGDGVGDLRGIMQRLQYLVELGIDAIWISPIFPSPMADFGYDICDYTDIDPLFGTLAGFDQLLAAAHRLGLKVLLDLVPNHTSNRHPWFVESRSSRSSARRQWYLWRDPAPDGGPPNNWLSQFGGSAWELHRPTGQYYYHAFLREQPDLNWRNGEVRRAIYDVMRFWLRRGVDGFRVDVMWQLIKDDQFRDNPPNPAFAPGMPPHKAQLPLYTSDRPEMDDLVIEMRGVIDEFDDRVLIGEIYLPVERLVKYYGRDLKGAHLPFNFSLLGAPWHAGTIARLIAEYEAALPARGWPNWVLGNHDWPRIAGRVGAQARIAAVLLLTLRGTPTIYYGDEIGMPQVAIPPERVRDPFQNNVPALNVGRDGCRTPMQWDGSRHAGFSEAEPWLPLADDFATHNVAELGRDPASIYSLYRRLVALRRSRPALTRGGYSAALSGEDLLIFVRQCEEDCLLVALNFGNTEQSVDLPPHLPGARILLSSNMDREGEQIVGTMRLGANEGVVLSTSSTEGTHAA